MSATGRGTTREASDFYPTPKEAFDPLIPYLLESVALTGQIYEPAWGDRRLVKWMLEAGIDAWGADLNDPDPEFQIDFLKDNTERACVLTNPPFSLAFEFCQHAMEVADNAIFLLRLSFLAAGKRRDWFRQHEPRAIFVLSDRPNFAMSVTCKKCEYNEVLPIESERPKKCPKCGSKVKISTSDSADYGWFLFTRGEAGGGVFEGIFHL
jgi:ribosomal protein S27E